MGQVIGKGLEYIVRIDGNGYVFDKSGHCEKEIPRFQLQYTAAVLSVPQRVLWGSIMNLNDS